MRPLICGVLCEPQQAKPSLRFWGNAERINVDSPNLPAGHQSRDRAAHLLRNRQPATRIFKAPARLKRRAYDTMALWVPAQNRVRICGAERNRVTTINAAMPADQPIRRTYPQQFQFLYATRPHGLSDPRHIAPCCRSHAGIKRCRSTSRRASPSRQSACLPPQWSPRQHPIRSPPLERSSRWAPWRYQNGYTPPW